MTLLLRDVEVDGRVVDVRVVGTQIVAVGPHLNGVDDEVLDGGGGALLPGLHDHHLHLYAAAAAITSVTVGPAQTRDSEALQRVLREHDRSLEPDRWLRAVGYHESVAGDLDRDALDRLVPHRPARVQHRTGARWTLNSAAIDALGLDARSEEGIEREASGRPTGRLHRADAWLRDLLPPSATPDLGRLGAELASCGVTGVTDTTPFERPSDLAALAAAVADGSLAQRVLVTGGPALTAEIAPAGLELGPVKLVIDDGAYPALDALVDHIDAAHRCGRTVAIHCVTRTALVLALVAWDTAGSAPGDRVEHGSVVPAEQISDLRRLELTVVTQPGFVAARGDDYLRDVDPDDVPHLYRCKTLLDAGIPVAGSTDAPYTATDPWSAMRAAVERTTPSGAILGADEVVAPLRALQLFLGDPHDPGGPPRTITPGAAADLCLLNRPLADAMTRLRADDVLATVCAGRVLPRSETLTPNA